MAGARSNANVTRCSYCGAKNKSSFEYCVRCSESLNDTAGAWTPREERRSPGAMLVGVGIAGVLLLVGLAWVTGLTGSSEDPPVASAAGAPRPAPASSATRRSAPILENVDSKEVLEVYNQAMRAFNASDYPAAIAGFTSVADSLPDNPSVREYLGLSHFHSGNYDEAMDELAEARAQRPHSFALLDHYVTAAKANNDNESAIEALSDFVDTHPEELEARLELARLARQAGDEGLAIAQTEYLATQDGLDPEFVYEYGVSLKEAGRIDEAKSVLKNSIELDPESAVAHHALGVTELATGDVAAAASAFEAAVARAPDNGDFQFSLAQAYEQLDRIPESLEAYELYLQKASPGDRRAEVVRRQLELAKQAWAVEQARTSQSKS